MGQAPSEVADGETIVRVILHPFHFDSKGRLKPQAFESPRTKDEVSVIRLDFSDATFCKRWGKHRVAVEGAKEYKGLAAFRAASVRAISSQIIATPKHDCPAHADIRYGYVRPQQDEPGTPREIEALRSRLKELIRNVKYYPDQDVTAEQWTGDAVTAPA